MVILLTSLQQYLYYVVDIIQIDVICERPILCTQSNLLITDAMGAMGRGNELPLIKITFGYC